MKTLVTGGRGFIGRALVGQLRANGHDTWSLDLTPHHDPKHYRADVRSYRSLENILKTGSFDIVYHLAAETGRWNGEENYEALWTTNVIGTKHLLRLQETLGFQMVFVSSSEVYGDYSGVMHEEVPDRVPILLMNDYAMTKWVGEMQIRNAQRMSQNACVIFRLFNVYGPGETFARNRGVIARFIWSALHDQPFTVYTGHTRSFTYIDDVARTLARASDRFRPGAVYNVGGTTLHAIETIARTILAKLGKNESLVSYAEAEPFTTRHKRVDVSRAVEELDYAPQISLEEGLDRTIAWARTAYARPE